MIRKVTITACTIAAITTLVFLVAGHWGYQSGRIGFALPGSVALVGCDGGNLDISHFDCPGVPPPGGIRPTRGLKTFLPPSDSVASINLIGGPLSFASPPKQIAGVRINRLDAPRGSTATIGGLTFRCTSLRMVYVPLWMPFVLFAVFPVIAACRGPLRRRRRRRRGLCVQCGYDLTGNTTGVCSECGQRVERDC
ncbi:MAG: hypothetical protein IIB57_02125 [Planctomycetes bacterium]|nr:hypothetical protein [Planctomycetota bacterium]